MRTGIFIASVAAGLAFAGFAAAPAAASIIEYDVTDYNAGTSCSHGLWTNARSSGCSKNFSFQDGTSFTVDTANGTGTFTGTAINNLGEVATIDFALSGLVDDLPGGNQYKAGGLPFDAATIDFFTDATGTIDIDGTLYSLQAGDPFAGNTLFQFGTGANDKTADFGGSSWLNVLNPNGHDYVGSGHWDINFNLSQRTDVPAPGMVLLLGLGAALVLRRRGKGGVKGRTKAAA